MTHFKPHNIRLFPSNLITTEQGEALPLAHLPDGPRAGCQIRPLSAEAAFRRFGVEKNESFLLVCDLEDAPRGSALDTLGTLVWWEEDALWLKVETPVRRYLADPETAHATVLLVRAPLRSGRPRP